MESPMKATGNGENTAWRWPYCWPVGYGLLGGALLVLLFALVALPIAFLILCVEVGPRKAWQFIFHLG